MILCLFLLLLHFFILYNFRDFFLQDFIVKNNIHCHSGTLNSNSPPTKIEKTNEINMCSINCKILHDHGISSFEHIRKRLLYKLVKSVPHLSEYPKIIVFIWVDWDVLRSFLKRNNVKGVSKLNKVERVIARPISSDVKQIDQFLVG